MGSTSRASIVPINAAADALSSRIANNQTKGKRGIGSALSSVESRRENKPSKKQTVIKEEKRLSSLLYQNKRSRHWHGYLLFSPFPSRTHAVFFQFAGTTRPPISDCAAQRCKGVPIRRYGEEMTRLVTVTSRAARCGRAIVFFFSLFLLGVWDVCCRVLNFLQTHLPWTKNYTLTN